MQRPHLTIGSRKPHSEHPERFDPEKMRQSPPSCLPASKSDRLLALAELTLFAPRIPFSYQPTLIGSVHQVTLCGRSAPTMFGKFWQSVGNTPGNYKL